MRKESRRLKAESSKLRAQSSKLKAQSRKQMTLLRKGCFGGQAEVRETKSEGGMRKGGKGQAHSAKRKG